jgi:hypothetical protein
LPIQATSSGVIRKPCAALRSGAPVRDRRVSTGLSLAALFGGVSFCSELAVASTFLHPFAPPALPGFHATMGALTPAPTCLGGRWPIGPSGPEQVSLCYVVVSSNRSVSNHPLSSPESWSGFHLRDLPSVPSHNGPCPRGPSVTWASPLASRLATTRSRIEFVILRTSRSPPVAPHPVSRRRSYLWLQSPDRTLAGTCTLPIPRAYRRTSCRHTRPPWKMT